MRLRPGVFTIPPGVPFLPTLADAVLAGHFGLIGDQRADPLALADVTILLPTRRAARALREAFLRRAGGEATILPRIRTIADADEDSHLLESPLEEPAERLALPPAVPRLERQLVLAALVTAWASAVRRELLRLDPGEPLLIPASAADAMSLAADLAGLMDEMAAAGIDWSALHQLEPADYPGYWQITLDFLRIAAEAWPAHLAERGLADPIARRDSLIRAEAARLSASPPPGPIIAAGSTGSVPATAELLAVIARLPAGAVVLPGLDQRLDDLAWAAIGTPAEPETAAPSHPQFALKQLLAVIGVGRAEVTPLGVPPSPAVARAAWVSRAMRPAETTDTWADEPPPPPEATDGVSVLVARNEQEEALAIAIALRETVERPGQVAALATPDRALARRVAAELRRWGLEVDDSAGRRLDQTPAGVFARLLAEAALSGGEPRRLLALLKHPLAAFGLSRRKCRRAARILEIAALRGARLEGGIAALPRDLVNLRLQRELWNEKRVPRARRRLGKFEWAEADKLAAALARVLGPLEAAAGPGPAAAFARLLAGALDAAAEEAGKGNGALWDEPDGQALAGLLAGLLTAERLTLRPEEFPAFLGAAMAGVVVAPPAGTDPRIHIWGALEARLQTVDLLILGGLDESVWPGETRTDPWLSRRMRSVVGLPQPERRIGLAAHDFTQAMGARRVILSRAEKRGGAPTVASRWLQRLLAVAGDEQAKALTARGRRHVDLARVLDRVAPAHVRPAARPQPRPRIDARPRELSVTAIETLIRDPYAVYARRILQLEPLEEIGQPADARLRGTLIHDALAEFTNGWRGAFDDRAREALLVIWARLFEEIEAPEIRAMWWMRAEGIARWFVDWEAGRDGAIATRHAEISGRLPLAAPAGPFHLIGRADRIDIRHDGRIDILDYKTGMLPTAKQVLPFSPQLALEAAMAAHGGFGTAFAGRPVATLAWIGLARVGKDEPLRSAVDRDRTADDVGAEALARLSALIARYDDPRQPYVSQARPMFERRFPGDYDHLARVAEWRLLGGGGE